MHVHDRCVLHVTRLSPSIGPIYVEIDKLYFSSRKTTVYRIILYQVLRRSPLALRVYFVQLQLFHSLLCPLQHLVPGDQNCDMMILERSITFAASLEVGTAKRVLVIYVGLKDGVVKDMCTAPTSILCYCIPRFQKGAAPFDIIDITINTKCCCVLHGSSPPAKALVLEVVP